MSDESGDTDETRRRTRRRRFLALAAAGATTGLAGCGGGGGEGGNGGEEESPSPTIEQSPATTEGGGETGTPDSVPAEYETATAQDGSQRNPNAVASKASVEYQSNPNDGEQCSGCQFYIPDKNGDGFGACSIVAGKIDPEGWCVSYSSIQTETGTGTESG